jgi:NADH-quinone oxidoreductase subunit F
VGFGAGGIVVYGEETDMVRMIASIAGFFARESCGKCVPCREGTHWMYDLLRRIVRGGARPSDVEVLESVATNIAGRKTLCALGDFAVNPVGSGLRLFRAEFEAYCTKGEAAAREFRPEPVLAV